MEFNHLKNIILKLKNKSLPGIHSHRSLVPSNRVQQLNKIKFIENYKRASVALIIYPDENEIARLVLIQRSKYEGVHSGQISFPGGKYEKFDKSFMETALRETREEIGVDTNSFIAILELSNIYIPPSNFMVYPFLFLSNSNLDFSIDKKEVIDLITPTVDQILSFEILNGEFGINKTINPYFDFQSKRIWGATAMILKELIDLLVK